MTGLRLWFRLALLLYGLFVSAWAPWVEITWPQAAVRCFMFACLTAMVIADWGNEESDDDNTEDKHHA